MMREYVAQVAARVRTKKPETETLGTTLVAPLASWGSRRPVSAGAKVPTPAEPLGSG